MTSFEGRDDSTPPSLKSSAARSFGRVRLAFAIAIAADAIQILALPFFAEGLLSPLDDILEVATGVSLMALLGWHWTLLPGIVAELVPGLNLIPSWTASVWLVTRMDRGR